MPVECPAPIWPLHGRIDGPIVLLGFGSIGRGVLPLLERHIIFDKRLLTVIDASSTWRQLAQRHGVRFQQVSITRDNYVDILTPLLREGEGRGRGFCLNLAVDVSSRAVMELCRSVGAFYLDAGNEPWPGLYYDRSRPSSERTTYALRQAITDARDENSGGLTAISSCGANPGMSLEPPTLEYVSLKYQQVV
jgi:homospermidine synthase